MSADLETAAVTLLSDALKARGVDFGGLPVDQLVNIAKQWIDVGVNMASNAAQRHAEAAGKAAADAVNTEPSAEAELRKR